MKSILIAAIILLSPTATHAGEKNPRPWDRETIGVTPVGSDRPNTPRQHAVDYGVRYTNGAPSLGCRQRTMDITTPDGKSGPAPTFDCKW